MKIQAEILSNKDKVSWSFNVLPAFNFGNHPYRYGSIINFAWLFWFLHIRIFINDKRKPNKLKSNE